MKRLKFTIEINASAEKIWQIMWEDQSYRKWVEVFCPGTYYNGEIKEGSLIDFLTPEGAGLHSKISKLVLNEYFEITHITEIKNFEAQPITPEIEKWTGCLETYTLNNKNGFIELICHIDCLEEYISYFEDKFPKALSKVKELSEI